MVNTSARANLPLLVPNQGAKELTHNEAITQLEGICIGSVFDLGIDEPPGSPDEGLTVIVGDNPTGVFVGHTDAIAHFYNNSWKFYNPQDGWVVTVARYSYQPFVFSEPEGWRYQLFDDGALTSLESISHRAVSDLGLNSPPANVYTDLLVIVGDTPVGVFEGQTNKIAHYYNGKWFFYQPRTGWVVNITQYNYQPFVFDGVQWKYQINNSEASVDLEAVDDRVATLLQPGTGITLDYNDIAHTLTIASTVAGSEGNANSTRELLIANRTYHVSPTGSDNNTGLASNIAFQTIQKAVNVAASLDLSIYDITITLADGTYSESITLKGLVGSGKVIIQGNGTTPSSVLVASGVSNSFAFASKSGLYLIKDLKITNTGAIAIYAKSGGSIHFSNIDFGSCGRHLVAHQGGIIESVGNYQVSGGAINHMTVWDNGIMQTDSKTITFNTNPSNFSGEYLYCNTGVAVVFGCTFNNIVYVTGKKFTVEQNGVINAGGNINFLPGTIAGSTKTGGQYT